ncbi:MAG: ATP-dependent protease ATPase subunit HslU [Peptostreptococcales bacterium]
MKEMTPKEIVAELDKYIIGQEKAKKSVAVALRNRYRRNLLPAGMREEITPKNILMVGPTGVGKTEIARRLAKLIEAPFVKVEATKYTEVGYVGRDVESMVRDLVETSIRLVKRRRMEEKYEMADKIVEDKIIDAFFPNKKTQSTSKNPLDYILNNSQNQFSKKKEDVEEGDISLQKDQIRDQLRKGLLEEQLIEIQVNDNSNSLNMMDMGNETMSISLGSIFGDMMPQKTKKKKVLVKDARKILIEQEAQNLLDMDQVISEALENAEQNGIIFIDEIDKIAAPSFKGGANISREGVQRDILPIVEGSVVNTKYGSVKTDYMLFIGAGAFHISKVTDLIPELQGRFPIRVTLDNLTQDVFRQILVAPENALIKQHKMLLETEGVKVDFTEEAIDQIAHVAFKSNEQMENIGARRLHTVMENLLEDISFDIADYQEEVIKIDGDYVKSKFHEIVDIDEVDRYIL